MEAHCDSTKKLKCIEYIFKVKKPLYGLRQSVEICETFIHAKLTEWGLQQYTHDQRLYF